MIQVDRKTFLSICKMSERYHHQSGGLVPWINDAGVKDLMPIKGIARMVAGLGGGDEELTFAVWEFETNDGGTARGTTCILRTRLADLEAKTRLVFGVTPEQGFAAADQENACSEPSGK